MLTLPAVDPGWLESESSGPEIARWQRAIAQVTKEWLVAGGKVEEWLHAFRGVRGKLTRDAWRTALPEPIYALLDCVLLGSGARGEDLLLSDIDHAVITQEGVAAEAVAPHLYRFIRLMNRFGYPLCKGFVMAINERWIGSPSLWQRRAAEYLREPNWANVRYVFMLIDSLPLSHHTGGWPALWEHLCKGVRSSPFIQWEMAHLGIEAASLGPYVRWTRGRGSGQAFDIKQGLISPLVRSLQLLAITHDIPDIASLDRLARLVDIGVWPASMAAEVREALLFGWRLRLEKQAEDLLLERADSSDDVRLAALAPADFDGLCHHLETAKRVQRLVQRAFPKPR